MSFFKKDEVRSQLGFWTWFEKGKVEVGIKLYKNDENISVSVVEGKPLVFFKAYIIFLFIEKKRWRTSRFLPSAKSSSLRPLWNFPKGRAGPSICWALPFIINNLITGLIYHSTNLLSPTKNVKMDINQAATPVCVSRTSPLTRRWGRSTKSEVDISVQLTIRTRNTRGWLVGCCSSTLKSLR